jgi:nitrogen fixation/metabolism regulation signal transduction histidine kinase
LKSDLTPSRRFAPFVRLAVLVVLLTALTLIFSRQILFDATSHPDTSVLILVLVLPITLAGVVGFQAWILLRDRRLRRPGTSLKIRISLFFLLTTLLAAVPQAALSLTFINVAVQTADTDTEKYRTLLTLYYPLLSLPTLLVALLMSFSQSDDLIRPLINLESATRRVAAGDYGIRLLGPDRSALAFLTESFNAMTAELAASRAKLLQTEKVTAWQEIARRLAHELRNPLTPIRLSAERILRRSETDPQHLAELIGPAVGAILTEVTRLDILLKEFAGFARMPAPQKTLVPLRPLVEELLTTYRAAHPDLKVSTEGLPDVHVLADPSQLEQVFTNLFKNSVEAMAGSGSLSVVANLVKKGEASYCRIQIHDSGPGIPSELRDRLFQPYVTTKADGTGLGLAIVERIVFDHQGRVWFESQPGFGTTFFLDLPEESA